MRAPDRPGPAVLAHFRPTWRQALGHGLSVGAIGTVGCLLAGLAAVTTPALVDRLVGTHLAAAGLPVGVWLALLLAPGPLGVLVGMVGRRRVGVHLDDRGIQRVPRRPGAFRPWKEIVDVRVERRRGRAVVAVFLRSEVVLRLRAPYDGLLLGHDPHFEHKVFVIRHVWETHRDWSVHG